MSEKSKSYYQERLPDLINSLKSQVNKNMEIIKREVEGDLGSDKYHNVLKGRRMAAEYTIATLNEIDRLEQEIGLNKESSYFKEQLPILIDCLKQMFDITLKVIDLDIDDEEFDDDLKSIVGDDINEIFGKDIANRIFKKISPSDKLSEDKFHNVLKARDTARIDNQWVLKKIDDLESILYNKEIKTETRKGWDLVSAEQK